MEAPHLLRHRKSMYEMELSRARSRNCARKRAAASAAKAEHTRGCHNNGTADAERDRECPICFECDVGMPELPCGHKICTECQVSLCSKSNNSRAKRLRHSLYFLCPMCRKRVRIAHNRV